jgi:hypothetical protein
VVDIKINFREIDVSMDQIHVAQDIAGGVLL